MELRDFQIRTRDKLLAGRSHILQAPTGAGKTRAALEPFFVAWEQQNPNFPRKCFYVVPRRVLASQFYSEYKALVKDRFAKAQCADMRVSIQTGEQPDDVKLEADLIFCTIDQFLASHLTMPYGLPRRLANINAGALVGSYIIMDEFHLHDPDPTLPTALHALRQLRKVAPILLMTATFSEAMLKQLANWLDADYECLLREETLGIDTDGGMRMPRQRTWLTHEEPMTASAILARHNKRSIALCNQVARAQTLYQDLLIIKQEQKLDIEVILLHSRFLKEDRRAIEDRAIGLFGKTANRDEGSVILIATQAIEVGVDITCEVLHTDTAPASSLIQRAGRCARYPQEQGIVIVYPVEDKPGALLPYTGLHAEEARQAHSWIQHHSNQIYDFGTEQALIDAVTTPRDQTIIAGLKATAQNHTDLVMQVLSGKFAGKASQALIRDADSRRLLIHANPDVLLTHSTQEPYQAQGFGISPQTLFKPFKAWCEGSVPVNGAADDASRSGEMAFVWALEEDKERDPESNRTEYHWVPINDKNQFLGASVICVHPNLATYNDKEGLLLQRGGEWQSNYVPQPNASKAFEYSKGYKLESYEEHIRLVMEVMREEVAKALPQMEALERAAQWPSGSLTWAAQLAATLHDVGKLSERWQGWVAAYQKEIGKPVGVGFRGAHTDSERGNLQHEAANKKTVKLKPPHAGESAASVYKVLHILLGGNNELRRAVLTAIARHHSAYADNYKKFRLVRDAGAQIDLTAKFLDENKQDALQISKVRTSLITEADPDDYKIKLGNAIATANECDYEWLAYVVLVRLLRAADSEGTGRGALH